jgi:hypothetical protein
MILRMFGKHAAKTCSASTLKKFFICVPLLISCGFSTRVSVYPHFFFPTGPGPKRNARKETEGKRACRHEVHEGQCVWMQGTSKKASRNRKHVRMNECMKFTKERVHGGADK